MKDKEKNPRDGTIVLPGDRLGVIEEFIPDKTCFEDEGQLLSSLVGNVQIDETRHRISVKGKKKIRFPQRGDRGFGQVVIARNQIASVEIHSLENDTIDIPYTAILHISNTSQHFVRSMFDVTRPGDWVKFEIIKGGIPSRISLRGRGLGVVHGQCISCGDTLHLKKRDLLECPSCGLIQPRVTSQNYGETMF